MTTFFTIISTSAPHIYHSALPLSPKKSVVWKLYEPHSNPLTRIVCGLPTRWEQSAASVGFSSKIKIIVWSPCSKLIAVVWSRSNYGGTIAILDARTLVQLSTLPLYKQSITKCLIFSPDTSLLTWIGCNPDWIISWDVQTGVQVKAISPEPLGTSAHYCSVTYSTCGTMIGLHSCNPSTSTISTYEILSGMHIYSHSVKELKIKEVWTHNEYLRYAVLKSRAITIWEVGFTSVQTLAEVESLSLPAEFPSKVDFYGTFYPTLSRIAFLSSGRNYLWDLRYSKYLLDSTDLEFYKTPSLSSDGCFLVCNTYRPGVCIWKESPAGYIFHQSLTTISSNPPSISPNGELLLTWDTSVAQLWHITDSSIPNLTTSTQTFQSNKRLHLLVFSPDKALAAITQQESMVVTILDLKSGVPRLTIDTGMMVSGLGIAGETVVIAGYKDKYGGKKIVTWNIPAKDCVLDPNADIDDSAKTTTFKNQLIEALKWESVSVSSDLHSIIIGLLETTKSGSSHLGLYLCDVLTGQCLASVHGGGCKNVWFTQDGHGVWCIDDYGEEGWKIIKDSKSTITKLEHLGSTKCPPGKLPWQCPPSYKITDGWIFHSSGKQLLWLPPHWWPGQYDRVWGGQFLALLNNNLPEVLILDLE